VLRFLGLVRPAHTLEQERSWIASILTDKQHQRAFIIESEAGTPIGTCGLRGIDAEKGSAFLGILIGEKSLWDHGYGTAAIEALLEYAFVELGLREVRLSCHHENQRALRCYEKAGFRPSSHLPERGRPRREDIRMAVDRASWTASRARCDSAGESEDATPLERLAEQCKPPDEETSTPGGGTR
jgi:RimJ/RimL family protein N-acetyltransferase